MNKYCKICHHLYNAILENCDKHDNKGISEEELLKRYHNNE